MRDRVHMRRPRSQRVGSGTWRCKETVSGNQIRAFSTSEMPPPAPDQAGGCCPGHLRLAVLSLCPSLLIGGEGLLPLRARTSGNDSTAEEKLVASWAAAQAGGSVEATPPRVTAAEEIAHVGRQLHPIPPGLQATGPGAPWRESVGPPSILPPCISLHPGASTPGLCSCGYRVGVITGHSRLRVRMEEAQLSAGTHQSPNPAWQQAGGGSVAGARGVPASCCQQGLP